MNTTDCDIDQTDAVETDNGEQIQIWPTFSKAGESEKLDRLWGKYASERERVEGLAFTPLELCAAQRMGLRSDRTFQYTTRPAGTPIYQGLDLDSRPIADAYLDEMDRLDSPVDEVVIDFVDNRLQRLKPYAEARAALRKAIILAYPKTREQRIAEIMNVARLYLTMSFGAMRLDDLRLILHELEAAEAPTV